MHTRLLATQPSVANADAMNDGEPPAQGPCKLLRSDFAKIGPNIDDREQANPKEVSDDDRAQPHHRSST
jgi:hypothetical protein